MAVRWLSLDEFRAGEEQNPYGNEPAAKRQLKAVPESSYNWWMLGSTAYLFSVANRRRKAVPGEVWMPVATEGRRARRRRLVQALVVVEMVLFVASQVGSHVALQVFTVLVLVGIPVTGVASRRAGMRAWIDYRTGEVGVDDGLRRRRRARQE